MNFQFLMDVNDVALLLLGVCIIPIAVLLILAIIFRIKNAKKKAKEREKAKPDEGQAEIFLKAYGGKENIKEVELERSKIKVKVNDVELVDGEKLKELGATGVLLVGDEVRCSFGDNAENIYELIK